MSDTISVTVLIITGIYASIGLIIGGWFVFGGIASIDHAAANAPLGFRLVIWPGAAALWPWIVYKWVRSDRRDVELIHDT